MQIQKTAEDTILPVQGNDTASLRQKQRRVDIDLLRIIACFLVLFHHTRGYQSYAYTDKLPEAWFYSVFTAVTRVNVPIFFMISGAMLFKDKQESYRYIFKHRILRIAVVLPILISGLAVIGSFRGYIDNCSIETCFRLTLEGAYQVGGRTYWYLYSYIGVLLMLPLYRKIAKNMTKQDFLALFLIKLFFTSFLPILNITLNYFNIRSLSLTSTLESSVEFATYSDMFFPLIGYYLYHNVDLLKVSKKKLYLLFASGILGVIITCDLKIREIKLHGLSFSEEYFGIFSYLSAICVFLLIKYICQKHDMFASHKKFVRAVTLIGSLTYGIYLFAPFMKWVVYSRFVALISSDTYLVYPNVIYCILSMFVGGCITWLLKKIPVVKKVL